MNYKVTRTDDYQADERSREEDLQHFKYTHKEKVDGKWRYYYRGEFDKLSPGKYEKTNGDPTSAYSEYGRYQHNNKGSVNNFISDGKGHTYLVNRDVVIKAKSDKLLSKNYTSLQNGVRYKYDIDGVIEQKAKKTVKSIQSSVNKGFNYLRKLFG